MNKNIFYTTRAVCFSHKLTAEIIAEMVSWGVADPKGARPDKWMFSQDDFERIVCASQFSKELQVNIPGAALALELLQELDKIREQKRH